MDLNIIFFPSPKPSYTQEQMGKKLIWIPKRVEVKKSAEKQQKNKNVQNISDKGKQNAGQTNQKASQKLTQILFNDENSSSTTNTSHLQNGQNYTNCQNNVGNYKQFSAQSKMLQSQSSSLQFANNKSFFMGNREHTQEQMDNQQKTLQSQRQKNNYNCNYNNNKNKNNSNININVDDNFQGVDFNTPEKIAQRNVFQSQNFQNINNLNNNNNSYRGMTQAQSQPNSIGKAHVFCSLDSARFLKVLGNKLQFQAVPQVDIRDQQNQSSTSFLEKSDLIQDDIQNGNKNIKKNSLHKVKNFYQLGQQRKHSNKNTAEFNLFKNGSCNNINNYKDKQNAQNTSVIQSESQQQMTQSNQNNGKTLSINTRYANLQSNYRNNTFSQINKFSKNQPQLNSNLLSKNNQKQKENNSINNQQLQRNMTQNRQNQLKPNQKNQYQIQQNMKKQPLNFNLNLKTNTKSMNSNISQKNKDNNNKENSENLMHTNIIKNNLNSKTSESKTIGSNTGFQQINNMHYNDGCMMNSGVSYKQQLSNRNVKKSQHSFHEKTINPGDFDEFQVQNTKISLVASPVSVSKYQSITFRKNCFQSQELNLKDIQLKQGFRSKRNSLGKIEKMEFSEFSQPPSDEKMPYDLYQNENSDQDLGKQVQTEQVQGLKQMNTASLSYNFKKPSLMDSINQISNNYISPRNKYFKCNTQGSFPNKKVAQYELQFSKHSKDRTQILEDDMESFNVDEYDFNYKVEQKQQFLIEKYIPCMLIKSDIPSPYFLVYFHGNGEDINQGYDLLEHIRVNLNINIIAMEYPGYGLYKGTPNDQVIQEDSEVLYNFLRNDLNLNPKQIILLGRSIGSGVATYLASKQKIGALILVSAFTSIRGVTENLVGTFASYLVKERFINKENIKKVEAPVLLIHGKKDKLIPYQHSEILRAQCKNSNSQILLPEQMTHTEFDFTDDLVIPIYNFLYQNGIDLDLEDYLNNLQSPTFPDTMYYNPQLQLQTVQL